MHVLENAFIKKYVEESVNHLKLIAPDLPDKYLQNFVQRQVLKTVKDQPVRLQNTYTEEDKRSSLLSIAHFLETQKPIIAGNGSFYIHHEEAVAPANDMLINFRARRTEMKNAMFECREKGDKIGELRNNLGQNNEKIKMNSYYGAMGQKFSFQYNPSCAGAITSQGRSVITTTMWFNETFIGANIVFDCLDDMVHYIKLILEEEIHLEMYEWIDYMPTDDDILKFWISHYEGHENPRLVMMVLRTILNKASDIQKVKLFYKNNMIVLLEKNPKIMKVLTHRIIAGDAKSVEWLNPNKVPEEIAEPMDVLWNILEEFVYMKKWIMYDKVDKYVNHKREIIMYSDTDSVFIYVGFWVFKVLEWVDGIKEKDIDLNQLGEDKAYLLKIINVLTRLIFIGVHKSYDTLCENVNISQPYRKYINIKNEFLMDRYIAFPNIKKNYINRVIVQEGNILKKPDIDAKGGNLNAKSKNAIVTKRVKQITEKVTMDNKKILPEMLLREIYAFQAEMRESLLNGETKFLSPIKVKNPEEYDKPYQNYRYLAVEAYRIATDDPSVSLPGSFNLIDVNMGKLNQLEDLKENHLEIYDRLATGYFSDQKLGKNGIKYIAIPLRYEQIPKWIIPYVNIDGIIRKHLSPLVALLPSLGLKQEIIKSKYYYSTVLAL